MITPANAKHVQIKLMQNICTVGTDYHTARAFVKGIGPAHQLLSNELNQSFN